MKELVISIIAGMVIWAFFAILKLKLPAPDSFIAIASIFGTTAGYKLMQFLLIKYF